MKVKMCRFATILILIVGLSACGGGSGGSSGGSTATVPNRVDFIPPAQNADGSVLTDLSFYRVYYGSDTDSLAPVFDVNTAGSTITSHMITSAQKEALRELFEGNSTHFFAITAVNSQNLESSFSNIIEYL